MKIGKTQSKIILLITLLALFFTAILFIIKANEEKKLTRILIEERSTKRILIDNIFNLVGKGLEFWAFNDTYWDEMVACVQNSDSKWGDEIIAQTLPVYSAHAAWLYKTDFSLAYSTNLFNDKKLTEFPIPKQKLAEMLSKNGFNYFFVNTEHGLLEIRTAPVQPSSDIARKTPARGFFIVGRIWTQEYISSFNLITSSSTSLHLSDDAKSGRIDSTAYSIIINKPLHDYEGKECATLTFVSQSEMLRESAEALNWQLITGITLTVGLLISISLFLISYVTAPLRKISRSLEEEKSVLLTDLSKSKTEFGKIATLITDFFRQKEELTTEMSRRVKVEADLLKSTEELKEINATKDKFISIIAHDLRGPFNGFLGLTEILSEEADKLTKEELLDLSKELHKTAKTQYRLLSDLLQWSRIQSGRMEFTPTICKLEKLVDFVFDIQAANAENKNISLVKEYSRDFELVADVEMMQVVLRNLISNAIKFTSYGGKITVSAKLTENFSSITISDTGIGIQPEDIPKLFRIDIHHSTEGTHSEKGTGLGLVLCKDIIDRHSGKILVESKIGKGTSITISLPFASK
ncbi:MAG: ATP-binding protein [Melioribacteraceae bacterium]